MKRISALLLAAVILFGAMAVFMPTPARAESLYIKKIVSVVYDDSESMLYTDGSIKAGDKAAYANYALQAFCGMLNEEDQLFVTYMNADGGKPQSLDLTGGGIQSSINSIQKHGATNYGTPFSSVETAFEKLRSVKDSNPNTQYWLVVITDGVFDRNQSTEELDKYFQKCTSEKMPNGTKPQVTFMSIGNSVISPTHNASKGVYANYNAKSADGVLEAMSKMADKISGRSRLEGKSIKQVDNKTIQVSSSIPLLNIAVLSQSTGAKIASAAYDTGANIPISRKASLNVKGYSTLTGGAFLLGNSSEIIQKGTYNITFDTAVDVDDIVVLFEPALELRTEILLNGQKVDPSELAGAMEKDKITVSCKVYEMGTDVEVPADKLPSNTKYALTISENGKEASKAGKDMSIKDYECKQVLTKIYAKIEIPGFQPIDFAVDFTPVTYVPKVVYTLEAGFGSDLHSVKLDDIASNQDMTIQFTLFADGKEVTDPNTVQNLGYQVDVSPEGNSGTTTVNSDGKIVFTPNVGSVSTNNQGYYDVTVTCTVNGVTAAETYRVLIAEYQVIPTDADAPIRKTEFFGNQTGVSFRITKDGVPMGKKDVENLFTVSLNEEQAHLLFRSEVEEDGTIIVTPYCKEGRNLNFFKWWFNWAYYFGLEGSDVTITMSHSYGTASAKIDVISATVGYQILNVYLPLFLEILIIALIAAYIIRYITKPRFAKNAALYVGSITRNRGTAGTHLMELREAHLAPYNTFKNLWNPFKELTVSVNGVSITAAKGNKIICNEPFPWYADGAKSKNRAVVIHSPKDIVNYCLEKDELVISEIKTSRVMDEQNRLISQDDSVYYFVRADVDYVKTTGANRMEVIDSAVAFCYSTIQI